MDKTVLLAAAALTALLLTRNRTYPVAANARQEANKLQIAANKLRNTAVSVSGSVNAAGAALGDIATTTGRVWDSFSRAFNVGSAALPEYGSNVTSNTILSGTDPEVVALGVTSFGGVPTYDTGGENALDPAYYDPYNYSVNA